MSREPLYEQIAAAVRAQIDAGELEPHSPAPSERVLGERFGVSRMTARAAVQALEDERYVYRNGRRGTFVAEPRLERRSAASPSRRPYRPGAPAELLDADTHKANGQLRSSLRLAIGEEVHLFGVSDSSRASRSRSRHVHPPASLSGPPRARLEDSLWLLLEQRYSITVARAEAVIQAVTPTAEQLSR